MLLNMNASGRRSIFRIRRTRCDFARHTDGQTFWFPVPTIMLLAALAATVKEGQPIKWRRCGFMQPLHETRRFEECEAVWSAEQSLCGPKAYFEVRLNLHL